MTNSKTNPTQEAPSSDVVEKCVIVCPQCEGEGSYADGTDEAACSTECTRCGGNGWIVDTAALASTAGDTLKAENERLREALQWYAKEYNWRSSSVYMCGHSGASAAEVDRGTRLVPPSASLGASHDARADRGEALKENSSG